MRRGCCVGKEDFLPEESFQSWSNYWKAVKETGPRLKDRIVSRSTDQEEIEEVRSRSKHEMKKKLNWWDLIWFGVGSVIGSGIFVLTGQEANSDAGPAVVLSYVVSGISAMLSVFCYTEFAVEIPVAGGSFAYLRVELGDFVAYIAAGNILLEYIIGQAAVARSWTSYFTTLLNHNPDDFRILIASFPEGYNRLDPIAFVVLILIGLFACTSIKGPSVLNYIATIVHVATLLFIIIAGLFHVDSHNLTDQFIPFGPRGVFKAAAVLYFSYVGFDAVATMAEETKDPAKDIPRGLVGSMSITTVLYCAMAVVLVTMQKYTDIDANAPYSVAFERVGMGWAKYIVAFGALEGMTTVLLVAIVGQGRYLTHIARTHMLPPFFSRVNERTSTPINATLSLVFVSATLGFFTSLDVLANLLSISTLFIFTMVAVALLVRRYYVTGETSDSDRGKLGLSLVVILGASAATAGYWATSEGWVGYAVTVPLWLLGTVGLGWGVPMARKAKTWGVPLVPWLPSASIAINIFLLGSIDRLSFIRFGVWTGLLFVYYFFFGLHASYDTAKSVKQLVVVEDHVEPTKEIGMA